MLKTLIFSTNFAFGEFRASFEESSTCQQSRLACRDNALPQERLSRFYSNKMVCGPITGSSPQLLMVSAACSMVSCDTRLAGDTRATYASRQIRWPTIFFTNLISIEITIIYYFFDFALVECFHVVCFVLFAKVKIFLRLRTILSVKFLIFVNSETVFVNSKTVFTILVVHFTILKEETIP